VGQAHGHARNQPSLGSVPLALPVAGTDADGLYAAGDSPLDDVPDIFSNTIQRKIDRLVASFMTNLFSRYRRARMGERASGNTLGTVGITRLFALNP